jgi:hypothetical protein
MKTENFVKKRLSDKLSEAILQALEDLEMVIKDPKYTIDFGSWHDPVSIENGQFLPDSKKCSVCFAGSVMAKRLNADYEYETSPSDFPEHQDMLYALDRARSGDVRTALHKLGYKDFPEEIEKFNINQVDYEEFVKDMKRISKLLAKHGY